MPPKRLILFSGLGGDHRLTEPIRIPGVDVLTPDHLPPEEGEDLPRYAARVADHNGVGAGDAVGGASFGGMIAAEIAKQRRISALILLGSCVRPESLPASYRRLESVGAFIPDWALGLRSLRPLIRWRFAPTTPEAVEILAAMAESCPMSQIRRFGRMLMSWDGASGFSCPVLAIHGDRDRIIPVECAEPGPRLKNAGHSFTLTHAAETSAAIAAFLK